MAHSQGLDRFDEKTAQFVHFQHEPGHSETIPDDANKHLYRRANGELWLQARHYLTRWNPQTSRAQDFTINIPWAFMHNQIVTDSRGNDYVKANNQWRIINYFSIMMPWVCNHLLQLKWTFFERLNQIDTLGKMSAKFIWHFSPYSLRSYYLRSLTKNMSRYIRIGVAEYLLGNVWNSINSDVFSLLSTSTLWTRVGLSCLIERLSQQKTNFKRRIDLYSSRLPGCKL